MNLQDYEKVCLAIKALYYVVDYKQPLFDPSSVAQKKAREKKTSRAVSRAGKVFLVLAWLFFPRAFFRDTPEEGLWEVYLVFTSAYFSKALRTARDKRYIN